MNRKMEFPLYDELVQRTTTEPAPPVSVWNYVMNLPQENTEMLFALVWHYAVKTNSVPPQGKASAKRIVLPYQGKLFEGGKGVVFRLEDLPAELRTILSLYVASVIQQ